MPIKKSTKPTTTTTKPKARTRKGRKKFHYITGTHVSPKSKHPVEYRSSWELYVCKHLDDDNAVASYEYEPYKIAYISNVRSSKVRFYIPDFVVTYVDGSIKIIEVKRTSALNNIIVMKKAEAARRWCESLKKQKGLDHSYEFWCESIVFPLMKKYKAIEETQAKLLLEKTLEKPKEKIPDGEKKTKSKSK